jgi:hypothetical protein
MNWKPGQVIKLRGTDGKPQGEEYTFVTELIGDKNGIQVKAENGRLLRVHRGQVVKEEMPKEAKTAHMGQEIPQAGKEQDMSTQAATETKVAKVAKEKKPKVKKAPVPFDMTAWIKENGGASPVHLQKKSEFDCKDFELSSHVLVCKDSSIYFTLNVYKYPATPEAPNGVISLGKKNTGGNRFPLKGKRFNVKFINKDNNEESKTLIGKKTAEEVEAEYVKKGYTKV